MGDFLQMTGIRGAFRRKAGGPAAKAASATESDGVPSELEGMGACDLSEVIDRFESPLLRYVGQIVGRAEDAQDIVQEVFLRYCRQSRDAEAEALRNLSSWLFSVAHNLAQDALRKRQRERRAQQEIGAEAGPAGDSGYDTVDRVIRQAASERALAELRRLPEELRQVLLLKIIQDMSLRDIARVTGLSFGIVAYRANQGIKELARRLREAGVV